MRRALDCERFSQAIEITEGASDGARQCICGPLAASRHRLPEEAMIPRLRGIVEQGPVVRLVGLDDN